MRLRELAAVGVLLVGPGAWAHATAAGAQNPPANPDAMLQKEFMDKVKEYDAARSKVESTLPPLADHSDPGQIKQREQALRRGLQRARRGAEAGDLFHKHTRALIRRLLAQALAQAGPQAARAIQEENPSGMTSRMVINGPYPEGL